MMFSKVIRLSALGLIAMLFLPSISMAGDYNRDAALTNAKLGLAYLDKGMYPASKDHLLIAIKEDPDVAVGWYGMAYYLEKTGDPQSADHYYRKAISVDPHSGSALNNYGTFLCRNGRYQEAIKKFMAAVHEQTYLQAASAYENAGICALQIPNNVLALKYFHLAVDNNPSMPFSLLSVARLSHQMGNDASAKKYFQLFKNLALYKKPDTVVQKYHEYVFSAPLLTNASPAGSSGRSAGNANPDASAQLPMPS